MYIAEYSVHILNRHTHREQSPVFQTLYMTLHALDMTDYKAAMKQRHSQVHT